MVGTRHEVSALVNCLQRFPVNISSKDLVRRSRDKAQGITCSLYTGMESVRLSVDGVPSRHRRRPSQALSLRAHRTGAAQRPPPTSTQVCLGSKHIVTHLAIHLIPVIQVFAQRYPRYLIKIVNRHEEFYATIIFFVERHYLRKHSKSSGLALEYSSSTLDASFAENFYGLKRRRHPWVPTDRVAVAVRGAPVAEKLRDREIWQSLFFLVCQLISCDTIFVDSAQVAVPYFRAKTHDYYEQLGGGVSSDILEDAGDGRRTQPLADDVCHFCAKK